MVQYAMSHFGLRSSEQLVATAVCSRTVTTVTGAVMNVPGRIFIFTNWMVWHGTGEGARNRRWDMCFLLAKMVSVSGDGAALTMTIDTQVEADQEASLGQGNSRTLRSNSRSRSRRNDGDDDLNHGDNDDDDGDGDDHNVVRSARPSFSKKRVQIMGSDPPNQRDVMMGAESSAAFSNSGSRKLWSMGELASSISPWFTTNEKINGAITVDMWENERSNESAGRMGHLWRSLGFGSSSGGEKTGVENQSETLGAAQYNARECEDVSRECESAYHSCMQMRHTIVDSGSLMQPSLFPADRFFRSLFLLSSCRL